MEATSVTRELDELYRQWFVAAPAHDHDFFRRHLADEWLYTDIEGITRGKDDYLVLIDTVQPEHRSALAELRVVAIEGLTAVVAGRYEVVGVLSDGKDVSSNTRFTAVWTQRTGSWRCIAHHATRLVG